MIQQATNKTSNIKDRLGKSTEELRDINEKFWKNDIRLRASYILVTKQKYNEATAFIKVEELKYPNHNKWFKMKYDEIETIEKLYNALTMSGSKYAGTIIEEGTLKSIIADKVRYVKEDGDIRENDWNDLDEESLVVIAKKVFPDMKESKIRALVFMIFGNIIAAAAVSNDDDERQATCDAVCEYKMDSIKRLYLLDIKKAKEEARDFLKDLSVSPEREEKFRNELKKLFSG